MKFKVVEGSHFEEGKRYVKGQTVETEHDLVKLFPNKFTRVDTGEDKKAKKDWDEEEEEDVDLTAKKPAKHASASQTVTSHAPHRTMRDK